MAMGARTSVIRTNKKGVTVLPTAEGRSPRANERWTPEMAKKAKFQLATIASSGRARSR